MERKAFVMMPLRQETTKIRGAIRSATNMAGFTAVFGDEINIAGKITDQIETEIRKADVCICVIANENPNVAWECGFASALRKPVILICSKKEELYFDVQKDRTILYDNTKTTLPLKKQLIKYLEKIQKINTIFFPELLIGTKGFEKIKLLTAAKNISDTPYGIFNLINIAQKRIFIAGQNLGFIMQNEINKGQFKSVIKDFLGKSPETFVEIMICDKATKHAIKT